ncbi:helix-turn-helix transcriptional regulator [Oleiagrimonas sp. C23AA]|uniref:helix-turn-helix domain-containing protein n=1 Tax=Oleiagrimonas sp. C23AA TaxID=2719047 RepID=UPI00141ED37C|nr:helix-turn-helix transcriptional regulator [Oleiagrimonas sp. C23AA]NII09469.1 helix-turn-helix transcriptional regulator [Oleiagrimonas sp. C23AA]
MTEKQPGSIYGRRLREARNSYKFSQTELAIAAARDMDSGSPTVSRYENGVHQPKLALQQRFADVLELPLKYFYTEDDEEARQIAEASRSDKPVQLRIKIQEMLKQK